MLHVGLKGLPLIKYVLQYLWLYVFSTISSRSGSLLKLDSIEHCGSMNK